MHLPIQLIVIVLALISHEHKAIAELSNYPYLVVPVNKHTDTGNPLYSVQITNVDDNWGDPMSKDSNYLIDIDAPVTWHDCLPVWQTHPISSADNSGCGDIQRYSYTNSSCHPSSDYLPDWGYSSCPAVVVNPLTGSCVDSFLNYDNFLMSTTDGKNVLTGIFHLSNVYHALIRGACTSTTFQSFPKDVTGVMAFSSSPFALPETLSFNSQPSNKFNKITALCLPSSSSTTGVLFAGAGPYYLLPQSNVDIRSLLSYTPLLKYPHSIGYFISVNAIVIKKRSVDIPVNATTKLSTIEPYTTLRTDIFTRMVRIFSKVTRRIPSAKPISPFSLCFSTSTKGTTVGFKVPNIGLRLQGGKTWTVSSANSIKQMTKDVGCLAFVDGGATSEPAITIGTFQIEDNLVVFDLENSSFGFTSSLLSRKTSCANFNFTQPME